MSIRTLNEQIIVFNKSDDNARLKIEGSEEGGRVVLAKEGFMGKALTFLQGVPLLKNLSTVKNYVESIKTENQEALNVFLNAIRAELGSEPAQSAKQQLLESNKPLTARVIKDVHNLIEARKRFGQKEVDQFCTMTGQNPSINASRWTLSEQDNEKLENHEKVQVQSGLKGIEKAYTLSKLDVETLIKDFKKLTTGNGALRSVITGLTALQNVAFAHEYINSLQNHDIAGGIPFHQWGTNGEKAEKWLNENVASNNEVALENAVSGIKFVADALPRLFKEVTEFTNNTRSDQKLILEPTLAWTRFKNLGVVEKNLVEFNNKKLPISEVAIDGKPVAYAGTYPIDNEIAISDHLAALKKNKCSALVVLAADEQIKNSKLKLPEYFIPGERKYGDVTVICEKLEGSYEAEYSINTDNDKTAVGFRLNKMEIKTADGTSWHFPVIHVTNWADHAPLESSYQLERVAREVNSIIASEESTYVNVNETRLPMVHCVGGVGRTGTLIGAMHILKNPEADFDAVLADMRATRSNRMVEKTQETQLKEMADRINPKPLDTQQIYENIPLDTQQIYVNIPHVNT